MSHQILVPRGRETLTFQPCTVLDRQGELLEAAVDARFCGPGGRAGSVVTPLEFRISGLQPVREQRALTKGLSGAEGDLEDQIQELLDCARVSGRHGLSQ